MPKPVLLDMDPGVDDALAILLAAASPEVEIVGMTTVSGNVSLEVATANALGVLGLIGRDDVPVLSGADRPLRREVVRATEVHGPTGMGNAELPDVGRTATTGAVDYLVATLKERPGEVAVVATGPLTNLALAEQKHPGILTLAAEVVVMGGAVLEAGNVTPAAEFNFFADPEAVDVVIGSREDVKVVGLDATHQVVLTPEMIASRLGNGATRIFVEASTRPVIEYGEQSSGSEGIFLHDPLAVAAVIDPSLLAFEKMKVAIETGGCVATGALVADRRPYADPRRLAGRPIHYAMGVEAARFLDLFCERISSLEVG